MNSNLKVEVVLTSPVFDLIAEDDEPPEVLISQMVSAPLKNQPNYPVIWGVIEDGTQPAEWGQ